MIEKRKYDVFISSSSKIDKGWVKEFASALKDAGITNFFDVRDIKPGARWQDEIENALRDSRTLVLILSGTGDISPWIFFELGVALADQKKIIPVASEEIDWKSIDPILAKFQFLKESSGREAGRKVAKIIEEN
ncbi:MAG: toll/interleukin-1 receptor domain-containing protein [Thermodesulfobacteriota bacterium]